MSRTGSKIAVLLVAAVSVGCDAEASTGPAELDVTAPAGLEILTLASSLSIDQELRLEARVLDSSGNAVANQSVRWSSTDTVRARVSNEGTVTGRYYGPVTVRASSGVLTAERPLSVVPGGRYSGVDLDYFSEVAFGAEYGTTSRLVRKWVDDLRVKVHGTPTPEDMQTLTDVMADLGRIMGGRRVELVADDANVDIYFAPEGDFDAIDPNYKPTNYGFFWVWWGSDQRLLRSRILISSTDISQEARSHLIREELTQSLGLMNDSWRYPESIYYQGWTSTNEYAPIDLLVIEMLYRNEISPGMSEEEAVRTLLDLARPTVVGSVVAAN